MRERPQRLEGRLLQSSGNWLDFIHGGIRVRLRRVRKVVLSLLCGRLLKVLSFQLFTVAGGVVASVAFEAEGRLGASATLMWPLIHGSGHFPCYLGRKVEIEVVSTGASDVRAAAGDRSRQMLSFH